MLNIYYDTIQFMINNNIIYALIVFSGFVLLRVIFKKLLLLVSTKLSTKSNIYNLSIKSYINPINFLILVIGFTFAKNILQLDDSINSILTSLARSAFAFGIFWIIFNSLTPLSIGINRFTKSFGEELSVDIANFIIKTLKFLVIAIGFVSILQEWGYNISGFLASLGLVGMAFALAAKDTAGNLFGSLVIFTDKPFKIGDWIKTPDVEGTIESIGIRSTNVRTFAQALVTVPNGILANSAILNWSKMKKRRIKMTLGLTYDTTSNQIEQITADIKQMLRNHSGINQDSMYVYFTSFNDSSLGIFCYFFTKTISWGEYMKVKEDINLKIMKIIESNNTSFAFPTQTLHIENNKSFT